VIVLPLPFPKPPMMANHRYPHWAVKGKAVKAVRRSTYGVARAWHGLWPNVELPLPGPVEVELIWTVTDRRRRDSDGPEPTKKACLDGLVDAGMLADDKSSVVVRSFCSIEQGAEPGVRLVIRNVDADSRPALGSGADEQAGQVSSGHPAANGAQIGAEA
jgi:crossover junction endodeoxyribonuclease RusA